MKKIFTLLCLLTAYLQGISQSTTVVISQVYGGGGGNTAGPTYNVDYVELHNISGVTQDISGYKLMYGSNAGNLGSSAGNIFTFPATGITIPAGGYLLIGSAGASAGGGPLPVTTDYNFTLTISATTGKIAFGTSAMMANTNYASQPVGSVIDFVGYGTANEFETAPTAALNNTTGAVRNANGCTETNNNSTNFTITTNPIPRNSASAPFICVAAGPVISAGANITNLSTTVGTASAQATYTLSATGLTPLSGDITITPGVGLEISLVSGGPYGTTPIMISYTAGVLANTTVYVRIASTALQGAFSGTVINSGGGASAATVTVNGSVVQNYYNTKANLGLTVPGTWSSTLNGLGTSPANFTDPYQYFNIVNQANVAYVGVWNVTGTDSKVIVGDGVNPLTFEISPGSDSVTSATKIDVLNNGLLSIGNNRIPTLNILATGSTVNFSQFGTTTADTIKIPAISYYNLYLTSGLKYFSGNTTTVRGDLVADATVGMNGPTFSPFATINSFGNVDLTNGAMFDPLPGGDAGRITLKMNGPGPVQQLNGDGTEIRLFRLQRDSSATHTILLGVNTSLTLGNGASGGLQLNPSGSTLSLGANTFNLINAGTSTTSASGKISAAGGAINILKSIGSGDAGTLRFTPGAALASFTLNLGPAVTKDSITIADNLTASLVNLVKGKIVMTAGDTLSALVMVAPTVAPYSFVDGAVRLTGTANLGFAVGKGNNFAPVGISNFGSTPQTYTVQYFNFGYGNYTIDPATLALFPAYDVSRSLYWNINSTSTNTYDAVFGYTDAAARIFGPNLVRIANFDNTDWSDRGGIPNPANTVTGGTVAVPAVNVYGPFTFSATAAGVVPVRLTSFAAQKAGAVTKVSWTTEQEINSKEFSVERSTDGGRSWTAVGVLPASGNSSSKRSYSFVDNSPAKGVNLYRLRSTDTDNKFTNSDTRAVLFANKDVVLITPNPASSFLNIFLSKTDNSLTRIFVTDANGRVIDKINTAEQSYRINTSRYAKGMYVVRIIGNENTITHKVVIQ